MIFFINIINTEKPFIFVVVVVMDIIIKNIKKERKPTKKHVTRLYETIVA